MKTKITFSILIIALVFSSASFAQSFTDSLLLDMPMDVSAIDISGNGNNGTLHNVVADTNRFGIPNTAFRFNGVDSYIEIPASPSMNSIQNTDVVTISAWVNIFQWWNGVNVFSIFERYNPITDSGWLFEANWAGGGILFLGDEANPNGYVGCNYTWNFHEWHFLALTYDKAQGGSAKFYVDSVQVCSNPYTASINVSDTTAPFVIGRSLAGPDEYTDGLIDEYKIYNRVLDSTEIENIFTTSLKRDVTQNKISVYPNPTNDKLTIQFAEQNSASTIMLYDMVGRKVFEKQFSNISSTRIDVADFAKGIYNLQVNSKEEKLNRKIIVE